MLALAIAASVASILLAVGPAFSGSARYDPTLAVLTATLISLVWSSFFTYLAAARLDPSFVSLRLDRDGLELEPRVENPTKRSIEARIWMRVWAGGVEQTQSAFYSGRDVLLLPPEGRFKGCVQAKPFFGFSQDSAGQDLFSVDELFVMLRVKWTDDSQESGDTGPRYYQLRRLGSEVASVVGREEIERLFPKSAGDTT